MYISAFLLFDSLEQVVDQRTRLFPLFGHTFLHWYSSIDYEIWSLNSVFPWLLLCWTSSLIRNVVSAILFLMMPIQIFALRMWPSSMTNRVSLPTISSTWILLCCPKPIASSSIPFPLMYHHLLFYWFSSWILPSLFFPLLLWVHQCPWRWMNPNCSNTQQLWMLLHLFMKPVISHSLLTCISLYFSLLCLVMNTILQLFFLCPLSVSFLLHYIRKLISFNIRSHTLFPLFSCTLSNNIKTRRILLLCDLYLQQFQYHSRCRSDCQ